MFHSFRFILILLCIIEFPSFSTETNTARIPQYPLKQERRIYTEERMAVARANIDQYERAKGIANKEILRASEWLSWEDKDLFNLIQPPNISRAFNVGTEGCPKCGKEIFEVGGTYPWKLDIKNPLKVECPICGGVFPDEDHPDPGRGWVGPTGHKYWFIGYANHWNLYEKLLPGIRYLARAYLLTGDPKYSHKSAVLLYRAAEVYPGMDYHVQSRYGELQEKNGARYEGKFVNKIWETGVLHMLSESYDSIWETIDDDEELQALVGKTGEEIRGFIEANLLEEGIEAVFDKRISGNYGMHQRALIYAALSRDQGPVDEWLDSVVDGIHPDIRHIGLEYALYNLVYQDGVPYETSPGYNFSWIRNISEIAQTLNWAGRNMFENPKMKTLYEGVLDVVQCGQHTPSLGDSGNVWRGLVGQDAYTFQAAYRAYSDERYRGFLEKFGATGESGFTTFETLFYPSIEPTTETLQPQEPRLLDGYGMAILNNASDTISMSLYYGYKGGHGHYDRLHFEIFANGWPMTPDLGYPDFMNAYVPGIFSWSKNTIAHNTVTVDAGRQVNNERGIVNSFVGSDRVRLVEVDAPATYPQCETYRRLLLMVDVDGENSYFVDFFTVEGGDQHDYSLHGPPGEFESIGGEWTEPASGTLAGATVEVGELYDDPMMGAEGYSGSFAGYMGSGFQHFIHPQRLLSGDVIAEYRHKKDDSARIRIRILPTQDQEIILADAQVSPVKHKDLIKYVIARREGKDLKSHFISVFEPYAGESFIESVTLEKTDPDYAFFTLRVKKHDGSIDEIQFSPNPIPYEKAKLPSQVLLVKLGIDDDSTGVYDSFHRLSLSERPSKREGLEIRNVPNRAEIKTFQPDDGTAVIEGLDLKWSDPTLSGNYLRAIKAKGIDTVRVNEVQESDGTDRIVRFAGDLRVGKPHITSVSGTRVITDALFEFGPTYRGCFLTDQNFTDYFEIEDAGRGFIELVEPLPEGHPLKIGEDAWVVLLAPKQTVLSLPSFNTSKPVRFRQNQE